MQRYELAAGSSAKFWEAGTEDSVLIVRFGRIGTQGQSKTKTFPSAQAAQVALDRLVREKTGKGYRPAGEAAPAGPDLAFGAVAAATGNAAASPAAEAQDVDSPSAETAAAETSPTPAARAEAHRVPIFTGTPLPTRSRPGAPLDAATDWAAFVARIRPLLDTAPDEARAPAEALAARLDDAPPEPDRAEARHWLEQIEAACPALRQRPWGDKPGPNGPVARAAFTHFARWLVARSGTGTLVTLFDRLRPRPSGRYGSLPVSAWDLPTTLGVRAALAAAPEAGYAEALEAALRLAAAEPEPTLARWLATVLADDRPGADHALSARAVLARCDPPDPKAYGNSHVALPLIVDLPPAQAAPWYAAPYHRATLATCDVGAEEAAATVIAAADAAGEPATPALVWLLEGAVGPERTIIARALLETRAADALDALLPFVGTKLVRDALDAADAAFPDWMLRAYLGALQGKGHGKGEPAYGPRAVTLAERHGHEAARAWAAADGARGAGRLDRLLAAGSAPQAAPEALPPVLRDPPWRRRGAARARPERAVALIPTPFAHGFDPDEALDRSTFYFQAGTLVESMTDLAARIRATEAESLYDMPIPPPAEPVPAADADPAAALAWLDRRLDLTREQFTGFFYFNYGPWFRMVGWQPEPLALMLWEKTGPQRAHYVAWRRTIAVMLSRFGARAVPGLVRLVAADPAQLLPEVEPVDAADLAPVAARAFHRTRKLRPAAAAWLRAHPRTAALRLLPETLGPAGPDRDAADAALRFLAAEPAGRAALDGAVAAYAERDPGVPEAVAAGVDSDPLEQVPAKPPKLPDWLVPAALPRPVLRSGGALPDAAVTALCEMLAFSDPLTPYAGVAQVRAACTPESLDAFAVALFQSWIAAGAKATGEWALQALALIGGDHAARDLTRQIRAWGQAGLKPRGRAGIAVLAGIGTDVALMNLSAIAEKSPLQQLREAARAAIVDAAEARGLDEVDLADRLSPDLGLDARGGLDLSFGERRFRVGFDETLKPVLRDAEGRRLAALPRPTKADDPESAKAASRHWAALRKDAEAAAGLQITRLEAMLASQRRVAPGVFWPFFAAHPLIRHLAGRLVWGLYPDAAPATPPARVFRLAEDLSPTDAADDALTFDVAAAEGVVGLVHPLHLGADALAAWSGLFADYEIAQPFPQLARETFAFTAAERDGAETRRFDGVRVGGRRLRGLRPQGWSTDMEGEHVQTVQRPVALPDGTRLVAVLRFEDGFWHRPGPEGDGIQTLRTLTLSETGWRAAATHRFGDLDPVTASEVLRTPSLLAAAGDA
ncbi:WGR domain-containing protein, predicted DNA-binding domain in MolR [Methylobacterium sp. UNC378MF]|uniref:DUF4132 domain-containing protein n=1 Tax=Methylobacterium sp. UNC378MF TaxID=1502748 RepID=UPI00087F7378|nr:DUF4132 domain-containing protein [Methylobacterium sp. UNC378MF]SDA21373.1 WGR domain-containing protein, predicted DNA-binding domain in MolR [Methylobacterium sp. UNC378MF]